LVEFGLRMPVDELARSIVEGTVRAVLAAPPEAPEGVRLILIVVVDVRIVGDLARSFALVGGAPKEDPLVGVIVPVGKVGAIAAVGDIVVGAPVVTAAEVLAVALVAGAPGAVFKAWPTGPVEPEPLVAAIAVEGLLPTVVAEALAEAIVVAEVPAAAIVAAEALVAAIVVVVPVAVAIAPVEPVAVFVEVPAVASPQDVRDLGVLVGGLVDPEALVVLTIAEDAGRPRLEARSRRATAHPMIVQPVGSVSMPMGFPPSVLA
jgi:hypothetical protein